MKKYFLSFISLFFVVTNTVLAKGVEVIKLQNPLNINPNDPSAIIGIVIQAVLGIIGGVALVMMVYGGFQWLTAAGNEEKIKNGTQTMVWSIIGLVLVFTSYLLVSTIFDVLGVK